MAKAAIDAIKGYEQLQRWDLSNKHSDAKCPWGFHEGECQCGVNNIPSKTTDNGS